MLPDRASIQSEERAMTNLMRIAAVGATLFGLSTPAFAGGPSTTIVNNGNNNVNIVVNVQGPTINLPPLPLLPPPPAPGCFYPPPVPTQNLIFNNGYGNWNSIHNRGWERGPVQNTIVNIGNHNHNEIRNHFR